MLEGFFVIEDQTAFPGWMLNELHLSLLVSLAEPPESSSGLVFSHFKGPTINCLLL